MPESHSTLKETEVSGSLPVISAGADEAHEKYTGERPQVLTEMELFRSFVLWPLTLIFSADVGVVRFLETPCAFASLCPYYYHSPCKK